MKWLSRLKGNFNLPEVLIAEYKEDTKCKHNIQCSANNDNLYRVSTNMILYTELIEQVFNIPVYARRSLGPCLCLSRVDGTRFLIWNLGQGRFVCFTLLHSYLQKWANTGMKIFALWKSITNSAVSAGISSTLQYADLHRSICGFINNLKMDWKKVFSCPTHGNSPPWIVSDGKNMGPLKRRVDHLKELGPAENDDNILPQCTKFKSRGFLGSKNERGLVVQMVTGDLSMRDFAEISEVTSNNGLLLVAVVRYILGNYPEEMPAPYKHLIANICKPTSVRGLLQVTSPEPLQYPEQFCKEELNLHSHTSQLQLQCVVASLPAIWPDLDRICNLANSEYLPKEVSTVILKLLSIRYDKSLNCSFCTYLKSFAGLKHFFVPRKEPMHILFCGQILRKSIEHNAILIMFS